MRFLRPLLVGVLCAGVHVTAAAAAGHELLFASEGSKAILRYAADESVTWQYPAEMSRDVWQLPNGNVLFCYNAQYVSSRSDNPSGVLEVTPDKKIVFEFKTTGQVWSCQRLPDGNTLVGAASQGKLLIVSPKGEVVKSIKVRNTPGHSCMRNARQLPNGHFLVAEENARAAREYSADGELAAEFPVPFPAYSAVRLENGHTIICGQKMLVDVDAAGKTVFSVSDRDIPEMGVRWFAGIQVLPGGNILVCNAGGKVPFFELTREKKIVWQATSPKALGHGIQCLDSSGPLLK